MVEQVPSPYSNLINIFKVKFRFNLFYNITSLTPFLCIPVAFDWHHHTIQFYIVPYTCPMCIGLILSIRTSKHIGHRGDAQ